jgi:CubicO group peptidase (beta-lactamase class C family)
LDAVDVWPVPRAAAAVVAPSGVLATVGDTAAQFRLASITKALVAYAALVAVEEQSISLDQPGGPPGSTVRHLLAHASGLPFRGAEPIAAPGRRRIYSNTGFDRLGDVLAESTGMTMQAYLTEAVFEPLGMATSELTGSPAHAARSTVDDLASFAQNLLAPTLVAPETLAEATEEQFPGLSGVVPGLGRFDPNPWGLGFELKGHKEPHWMGPDNSPGTFGHFGGSGTFLWVDPEAQLACIALTNREFGDWAPPLWNSLSSAVLAHYSATAELT